MNEFKIQFFRWLGIALGTLALLTIAGLLYRNWMVNFLQWPLYEQLGVGAGLVLLIVGSRMRYQAMRYEARNTLQPEPMPAGRLNERLKIYEERARANAQPPAPPAAPMPEFDVQLRKLHELKEAGIVTEEEFQRKKDEILNRM